MSGGRVLIVNPNSSERCSAGIEAAALRHAGPDVVVEVATAADGPPYVETLRDEVAAAAAVMGLLEDSMGELDQRFDALVIACSSDPGLEAARATFSLPVLGIGESALLLARGTGRPYAILTNVQGDEPHFWTLARRYGLADGLVVVEASGFTVEDFDLGRQGTEEGLLEAGRRAVAAGARSLCLGCAAMAGLDSHLTQALGVPVFEGVASAVHLAIVYVNLQRSAIAPKAGLSGGAKDWMQ